MVQTKRWTVELFIDENDGMTYAQARLHGAASHTVVGHGRARLAPDDDDVPEIGDELAAARALADLGHRMLIAAAGDISARTHEGVRLRY